jgi:hypothetical protein
MADENLRERLRMELENTISHMFESGWTEDQVRQEIEYVINTYEGARF